MKTKQRISEFLKKEILRLAAHGYGSRNIAIRVDVGRSLVRRVLAESSPEALKVGISSGSKLAQFQQVITEKVLLGLTTTRILRDIRDIGYSGSRTILGELVANIRVDNGITRKGSRHQTEIYVR